MFLGYSITRVLSLAARFWIFQVWVKVVMRWMVNTPRMMLTLVIWLLELVPGSMVVSRSTA